MMQTWRTYADLRIVQALSAFIIVIRVISVPSPANKEAAPYGTASPVGLQSLLRHHHAEVGAFAIIQIHMEHVRSSAEGTYIHGHHFICRDTHLLLRDQ